MYILSTAYLGFHVKATLFETVYLFMVGSVLYNIETVMFAKVIYRRRNRLLSAILYNYCCILV